MPPDWQTPLALLTVAIAAAWLLVRAWRRRSAARGCGSSGDDCGCATLRKKPRR
jgi:hypothetical protein